MLVFSKCLQKRVQNRATLSTILACINHEFIAIHFIVGVCPFFDTIGEKLQMGIVSCRTGSENCSARYLSTSVYKCKISIYKIKF